MEWPEGARTGGVAGEHVAKRVADLRVSMQHAAGRESAGKQQVAAVGVRRRCRQHAESALVHKLPVRSLNARVVHPCALQAQLVCGAAARHPACELPGHRLCGYRRHQHKSGVASHHLVAIRVARRHLNLHAHAAVACMCAQPLRACARRRCMHVFTATTCLCAPPLHARRPVCGTQAQARQVQEVHLCSLGAVAQVSGTQMRHSAATAAQRQQRADAFMWKEACVRMHACGWKHRRGP
jgi:hypothetical protein